MDRDHRKLLLDAYCYRGLWSWSIIAHSCMISPLWLLPIGVQQLCYILVSWPVTMVHRSRCSRSDIAHICCAVSTLSFYATHFIIFTRDDYPLILVEIPKPTLVTLWTSRKLICLTHFLFHYSTWGTIHYWCFIIDSLPRGYPGQLFGLRRTQELGG
jgi:hypothetical protein